jgi:hypothetical protein
MLIEMKYTKGLIAAVLAAGMMACGNRNTNEGEYGEDGRMAADTTMIQDGLTPRGLPEETIPNNSTFSGDSLIVGENQGNVSLPPQVRESIDKDRNLRNKPIMNTRTYTQNGKIYYELTFQDGQNTKAVFNEDGDRVDVNR